MLFGAGKARMGDVLYDSMSTRADAVIDSFLFCTRAEGDSDP